MLVECAWSYRYPPRVSADKLAKVEAAPPVVRDIAWKAQTRLTARYRALRRAGKADNVAITAVARELAAFIWAVAWRSSPRQRYRRSRPAKPTGWRRQTSCMGGDEATVGELL